MHDDVTGNDLGKSNFTALAGVETAERKQKLAELLGLIKEKDLKVVRVGFVDAHGIIRMRPIEASHFEQAASNGVPFTTALLAMDSGNFIFKPVFTHDGGFGHEEMGGAGDVLGVPDLDTFRILPWADRTGWILCDLYMSNGEYCPYDPRSIMKRAVRALHDRGYSYLGGVEIECHVFKVSDPRLNLADSGQPAVPPEVMPFSHGYQHMSELVYDEENPIIEPLREVLTAMGLPLRTIESELGPGQIEITFDPLHDTKAADLVALLRSTVKQFAKRNGMAATFMAKPGLPNVFSSGWHLHQSLIERKTGRNVFSSDTEVLSDTGRHFIGGILNHVRAGTAFSNPTINGYKRLNANPLTPKRAVWSIDNRAAMCRVIGGVGQKATHVENRSGEPAANPYLYMATQIFAGVDGIDNQIDPGPPLDDPYGQMDKQAMPVSLMDSIAALSESEFYRDSLSSEFIDYYVAMKQHEIQRFMAAVTDWEHAEYFENF
ncbi:glutamine synthetase family protein [Roseibium sp. M-1]